MIFLDRAKQTTTATGTGNLTLAGASSAYQALPTSESFYYCIAHTSADEWEVGIATVSGGDILRNTVLDGSTGTSAVNFSAGTKDVFCTAPARLAAAVETSPPTDSVEATTTDDTPTDVTLTLASLPTQVGGIRVLFVRYTAFAYSGSDFRAWDGKLFYQDVYGVLDQPSGIIEANAATWDIAADIVADELVFTVTGHAANPTYWKITASVDLVQELGV